MTDPLRVRGAANLGAAGLSRNAPTGDVRWELGVVVTYNSATHTSVVKTHGGRPLRDVPQMKSTSGAFDHLETGTSVVISWDLGFPVIVGCIDFVGPAQAAISPPSLTGVSGYGDDDPTQTTEGSNNYKPPTAPTDMSQGDWAQVGSEGNHVAVMKGGMTLLGSPTAQVRSFGLSGTLQQVSRRSQTITDFGQWRTENDQGKTSFILRAGSNQATQTGADEQNWTIRLDLGATGDVLDFNITDPHGRALFKLHAGSDGRVQLYGDGGVDISSGTSGDATMRQEAAGNRSAVIVGDDSLDSAGNGSYTYDGGVVTSIGVDRTTTVGGDSSEFITGNDVKAVGRDVNLSTLGSVTTIAGGDVTTTTPGNISLKGSHVQLGPTGVHPLPKFDDFLSDLKGFLGDLLDAIGSLAPTDPIGLAAAVAKITVFSVKVGAMEPYVSTVVTND